MDNNKIYVSEQEYSRLCRLDGRTDALIGYIAMAEKEYESRRNTAVHYITQMTISIF